MRSHSLVAVVGFVLGFVGGVFMPQPAPTLALPGEVRGEPGRMVQVKAQASGRVQWHAHTAGLDLFALPDDSVIVSAAKAGRYDLMAWTARGSKPSPLAVTVVNIGDAPVPPAPPPSPPGPDPFLAVLQAAWARETDPAKAAHRDSLAALYRQAAASTVRSPDLKTVGDLYAVMKKASAALLPSGSLPQVQTEIAAHLRTGLPTKPDAPLNQETRSLCAKMFAKVAEALQQLK